MRKPSPSEIRMAELCALRRPLTEYEADLVLHLRSTIRRAERKRERYASQPEYRNREIARNTAYWRSWHYGEAAE